jgi:hypothetical protein
MGLGQECPLKKDKKLLNQEEAKVEKNYQCNEK